jgi:hypothetical protein
LDSSVCRVIHNHFKCGFLCRLLPLYFPRDAYEEQVGATKLPTDVGDENGETVISERKIRISALPASSPVSTAPLLDDVTSPHHSMPSNRNEPIDALVDPSFMSMIRDPDQRRKEQWEKAAQAQAGWAWGKWVGLGGIGAPALSVPEQNSLHARFLARANALNLMEVAEMKILYALTYNL